MLICQRTALLLVALQSLPREVLSAPIQKHPYEMEPASAEKAGYGEQNNYFEDNIGLLGLDSEAAPGVGDVGIPAYEYDGDIAQLFNVQDEQLKTHSMRPIPEGDSVGMSTTVTVVLSDDDKDASSAASSAVDTSSQSINAKHSKKSSPEFVIPGYDNVSVNVNTPNDNKGMQYEQWMSPTGQVFFVPRNQQPDRPVFGAPMNGSMIKEARIYEEPNTGSRFTIFTSNQKNGSTVALDSETPVYQEVDLTMQGFPHLWRKVKILEDDCEEEVDAEEKEFPYGASTFVMVGLRKHSVDNFTEADTVEDAPSAMDETGEPLVQSSGLLWWKKNDDDCEEEQPNDHPFGTDHFLFVGAASVNQTNTTLPTQSEKSAGTGDASPATTPSEIVEGIPIHADTLDHGSSQSATKDDSAFKWTEPSGAASDGSTKWRDRPDLGSIFRSRYSNGAFKETPWSPLGAIVVMTCLVTLV
ncbi:unnamed protein product [Kuraishia capsulata CBS 1993]|uniref:Uncharacterized protein n=1 Tax=Kuraishia capsulata CBS 1993 TaxID=1382522 RepID=W6MSU7_9ASCO|nr:uncharacterized protein KUCA_T00000812001 [Kuraishia capsulata CBS 1993]CDK24845.1 unnamed protein product [Kuraishia capsulata CBS 1993]